MEAETFEMTVPTDTQEQEEAAVSSHNKVSNIRQRALYLLHALPVRLFDPHLL